MLVFPKGFRSSLLLSLLNELIHSYGYNYDPCADNLIIYDSTARSGLISSKPPARASHLAYHAQFKFTSSTFCVNWLLHYFTSQGKSIHLVNPRQKPGPRVWPLSSIPPAYHSQSPLSIHLGIAQIYFSTHCWITATASQSTSQPLLSLAILHTVLDL